MAVFSPAPVGLEADHPAHAEFRALVWNVRGKPPVFIMSFRCGFQQKPVLKPDRAAYSGIGL